MGMVKRMLEEGTYPYKSERDQKHKEDLLNYKKIQLEKIQESEKKVTQPSFFKLKKKLLEYSGEAVYPEYEPYLDIILARGQLWEWDKVQIKRKEMLTRRTRASYISVCILYQNKKYSIVTGWVLDWDEDFWYQHSWCMENEHTIIETSGGTFKKYFGAILTTTEIKEFITSEMEDFVKID